MSSTNPNQRLSDPFRHLPMSRDERADAHIRSESSNFTEHDCPTSTTTVTTARTLNDGTFITTTTTTVKPRLRPRRSLSLSGFAQAYPRLNQRAASPTPNLTGRLTIEDVGVDTLHIHTILYSTNREDGDTAIWLEGVKTGDDGDTKVEPPWRRYTAEEAAGVDFLTLGLKKLDHTPALTVQCEQVDTVVVSRDEDMKHLVVAVLVKTDELEADLNNRSAERGVDGVWYDLETVEGKRDEFVDEGVRRQIARGFHLLAGPGSQE